jgi:hypothetical protein
MAIEASSATMNEQFVNAFKSETLNKPVNTTRMVTMATGFRSG